LISVNGLENMAFQILDKYPNSDVVVSCLQARKDEFYYSVFSKDGTTLLPPQAGKSEGIDLQEILSPFSLIVVCGRNAKEFTRQCGLYESVIVDETISPLVSITARMALLKYLENKLEDVTIFEPSYLKPVYISGK